ncbi:MAG: NAD(P)-dependent alcohol dehydrogenase [Bacteroidota bacterium]
MNTLKINSKEVDQPTPRSSYMKAIVCTKYGTPEVLQLRAVEKPKPKEDEVLIEVHATSATSGDARIRRADPSFIRLIFGFTRPRNSILGVVVAGKIVAVGAKVTKFKVGDEVYGSKDMSFGAYATYTCMPQDGALALKPEQMSYEEAAAIPFGATAALHFLRRASIQVRQKVLIYGASGAIGTAAIQIAKSMGADVTAVCSSRNIQLVKRLGADRVIDYTKETVFRSSDKYDVVFETVGKSTLSQNLKSVKSSGILLLASADIPQTIRALWLSMIGRKKINTDLVNVSAEDLRYLNTLVETGQLQAVIDKRYPLDQMAEAHRYVDTGRKRGNVVVYMRR